MDECQGCDELRRDLIYAENKADDLVGELDDANDEIQKLKDRIRDMSAKINELYQMAD